MVKKIIALADWISAYDASLLLSSKHGRPISAKYIRKLSQRKRHPVRTQQISNRLLYNRLDLEQVKINKKSEA
jgi:hypothetical protein